MNHIKTFTSQQAKDLYILRMEQTLDMSKRMAEKYKKLYDEELEEIREVEEDLKEVKEIPVDGS